MRSPLYKINSELFIEVHIADIHFGVIDPKEQYKILEEQFINKIRNINFNILSINGDLFEHKFMSNSETIMYATMFIRNLVELCKIKKATLLLIHGTYSHDAGQLKLFYHYLNDKTIDIRIIEEVKFEYIKGKRILCIPELYGMSKDYYEKFLFYSGLYDSVYMHGTLKGAIYGKNEETLDSIREPVFCLDHFIKCSGPIISGHNHVPGCYNSYFYYCGSPYRWEFGEEGEKGFIILLHNTKTRLHYVHFEHIKSFRYDTINLDHMLTQDPNNIINYIKTLQDNGIDNIRVQFTINKDEIIDIVKSYYRTNPKVKIDSDSRAIKIMKESEEINEKYKQYEYVLDTNIKPENILTRYINQNKGYVYITTEDLIKLLKEM